MKKVVEKHKEMLAESVQTALRLKDKEGYEMVFGAPRKSCVVEDIETI